jgi:2-phospho-L-lactate/phosphoenolpyruvate guanylyltransferase
MTSSRALWVVIPLKNTANSKQRLASVLSQEARGRLALAMFEDVLTAVSAAGGVRGIIVVTNDTEATSIGARFHATISTAAANAGHTAAVTAAARELHARGDSMLTVPGDIPLIQAADVAEMIDAGADGSGFTIAPSRDRRGSNAILCSPAASVPLQFGDDSFLPHLNAARAHGIEPTIVYSENIGMDIDEPQDIEAFLQVGSQTRASLLLEKFARDGQFLKDGMNQ